MIRLFDPELAAYVRATLRRAVILSLSSVAAPVLARETLRALGEAAVNPEVAARAVRRRKRLRTPGRRRLDRVLLGAALTLVGRDHDGDDVLHEDAGAARARRRLLRLDDDHDRRLRRHHAAQRARQREAGRDGADAGRRGVHGGAVRVLHELGDDAAAARAEGPLSGALEGPRRRRRRRPHGRSASPTCWRRRGGASW